MGYSHTTSGLQRKHRQLTVEIERLREQIAVLHNQRTSCENALKTFGLVPMGRDKKATSPRFKRGEVMRFITDYMRENGGVTNSEITEALMIKRGEDPADRHYRGDIRTAVTNTLRRMANDGVVVRIEERKDGRRGSVWGLARLD